MRGVGRGDRGEVWGDTGEVGVIGGGRGDRER